MLNDIKFFLIIGCYYVKLENFNIWRIMNNILDNRQIIARSPSLPFTMELDITAGSIGCMFPPYLDRTSSPIACNTHMAGNSPEIHDAFFIDRPNNIKGATLTFVHEGNNVNADLFKPYDTMHITKHHPVTDSPVFPVYEIDCNPQEVLISAKNAGGSGCDLTNCPGAIDPAIWGFILPAPTYAPPSANNPYKIGIRSDCDSIVRIDNSLPFHFGNISITPCDGVNSFANVTVTDKFGIPHILNNKTSCPGNICINDRNDARACIEEPPLLIDFACPNNPANANGPLFKVIDPRYNSDPYANPGCPCPFQAKLLIDNGGFPFQPIPCEVGEFFGCTNYILPGLLLVNQDQNPFNASSNGVYYLTNPLLNALSPGTSVVNAKFFNGDPDTLEVTIANDSSPIFFNSANFTYGANGQINSVNMNQERFNLRPDTCGCNNIGILNSPNSCAINAGVLEVFPYSDTNIRQYGIETNNNFLVDQF